MAGGATPVVTLELSDEITLDLDEVKVLLHQLGLDRRLITEQSAICVLALANGAERDGLLPGKKRLRDGARIHDIIEFARRECGKEVAENTRESYRKLSLQPLCEEGLVVRHQLSTNDPKTFYRLHPEMLRLLTCRHLLSGAGWRGNWPSGSRRERPGSSSAAGLKSLSKWGSRNCTFSAPARTAGSLLKWLRSTPHSFSKPPGWFTWGTRE